MNVDVPYRNDPDEVYEGSQATCFSFRPFATIEGEEK